MRVPLPPPEGLRDRFQRLPGTVRLAMFAALSAFVVAVPWWGQSALAANPSAEVFFTNAKVMILILAAMYAIAAMGLNVVTGYTGLLNLGFGAFVCIGAYTTGILMKNHAVPFYLAIPAGTLHAGFWAVLMGYPTLRLSGDYFAIVTFGFAELTYLTARNWDSLTGGSKGLVDVPRAQLQMPWMDEPLVFTTRIGELGPLWALVIAMVLFAALCTWRVLHSRVGLAWRAIREDELAAQSVGIDLGRYKSLAFFVSGCLGGFAGGLLPLAQGGVYLSNFTFMTSVTILAYVVFGGLGSITGAIAGATILFTALEVLRSAIERANEKFPQLALSPELRYMVYGLLLILVVRFRPEGLFPSRRVARELRPETQAIADAEDSPLYALAHPNEGRLR